MARGDASNAPARADRWVDHELIVRLGNEGMKAADVVRAHMDAAAKRLQDAGRAPGESAGKISIGSVYSIWHRAGVERRKPQHLDLVPWVLRHDDLDAYPAQMLRAESQRRMLATKGELLPEETWVKLKRFLSARRADELVVHYDPDDPRGRNGFMYAKRRPGIDTDLIRSPWFTDKGKRIEHPVGLRHGATPPWESDDPEPSVVIDLDMAPVIDLRSRPKASRRDG